MVASMRVATVLQAALLGACAEGKPRPNVVGQYYAGPGFVEDVDFPSEDLFALGVYTHIRSGEPTVAADGSATCNPADNSTAKIVRLAHSQEPRVKVKWAPNFPIAPLLVEPVNATWAAYKDNYFRTIGEAARSCGIDGIEVDYEYGSGPGRLAKLGIVTPRLAKSFTQLLADLKVALGPGMEVSCDIGIWGIDSILPGGGGKSSFPLEVLPWVDAEMLNAGAIDFVNTMSYHYAKDGNIRAYEKDAFLVHNIWGFDKSRVNIGVPMYSYEMKNHWDPIHILREPAWRSLQKENPANCQDVKPEVNTCKLDDGSMEVLFVGKAMNKRIGEFLVNHGFRGAFPWAASYDASAVRTPDSLVAWLGRGLGVGPAATVQV